VARQALLGSGEVRRDLVRLGMEMKYAEVE
jgi:hypothetical protein